MYCPSCGKKIPDGSNFCMRCGQEIIYEDDYEEDLVEVQYEEPAPKRSTRSKQKTVKKSKSSNAKFFVILIIAFAVVFLGLFTVTNAYSNMSNTHSRATPVPTSTSFDVNPLIAGTWRDEVSMGGSGTFQHEVSINLMTQRVTITTYRTNGNIVRIVSDGISECGEDYVVSDGKKFTYVDGTLKTDNAIFNSPTLKRYTPEQTSSSSDSTSSTSVWEVKYYVDNFGDKTDKAYITNRSITSGAFSNSAVTNKELDARFIIDADSVSIKLFEYGDSVVKNSSSKNYEFYSISMKCSDGSTRNELTGSISTGGDRIKIQDNQRGIILKELREGDGDISFYIVEKDSPSTTYRFTVSASNFKELYTTEYLK